MTRVRVKVSGVRRTLAKKLRGGSASHIKKTAARPFAVPSSSRKKVLPASVRRSSVVYFDLPDREKPFEAIWPGGVPSPLENGGLRGRPLAKKKKGGRRKIDRFPSFGKGLVILQVRDPKSLYAYWELGSLLLARGRARLRDGRSARLVLRVYRLEEANRVFEHWADIDLVGGSSDWYLSVDPAGRMWVVEIGWLSADGEFVPLVRSNAVRTPPEKILLGKQEVLVGTRPLNWSSAFPAGFGAGFSLGAWHSPGSLWRR